MDQSQALRQDKRASGELPEVLVEKLVLAGQSILTLIADLKRDALLSDFTAMNKLVDEKRAAHELVRQESEERVQQLLDLRHEQVRMHAASTCAGFSLAALNIFPGHSNLTSHQFSGIHCMLGIAQYLHLAENPALVAKVSVECDR